MQWAFFGGVYNNYLALEAAIHDARRRGAEQLHCLGDLGAFGPHPDRVFPLLHDHDVSVLQGNYDDSIGNELADCQCGYTDPRDNHFAQISYDYTLANTGAEHRAFLRGLPRERRFEIDGVRLLLCHGSPRKVNEFLWESTTSPAFLEKLAVDHGADVILGTHTGLHWERRLPSGRRFVNVGVLGRPENDGTTHVWYTLVRIGDSVRGDRCGEGGAGESSAATATSENPRVEVEFVPVEYDHERLAREMVEENLPEEFVRTIRTGWWTTCLEVLPQRERRRGRY